MVVGLERDDVEAIALHGDGAGILGTDCQVVGNGTAGHIHHRHLIGSGERDVCLGVARKGNAHRLVEARYQGRRVDVLDGGDNLVEGAVHGIGVDDADRIGDVVRDPDLVAIWPHGDGHRIDADVYSTCQRSTVPVENIQRIRWRIRHVDEAAVDGNGLGMWAGEDRMTNGVAHRRRRTLRVGREGVQHAESHQAGHNSGMPRTVCADAINGPEGSRSGLPKPRHSAEHGCRPALGCPFRAVEDWRMVYLPHETSKTIQRP